MIEISDVRGVNEAYIYFWSDGKEMSMKTKSVSPDDLRNLYNECVKESEFYHRMNKELNKTIENNFENLKSKHCPTQYEIDHAGNILERVTLEIDQSQYIAKANENSGIVNLNQSIFSKYEKYSRLGRQILTAMKSLYVKQEV